MKVINKNDNCGNDGSGSNDANDVKNYGDHHEI